MRARTPRTIALFGLIAALSAAPLLGADEKAEQNPPAQPESSPKPLSAQRSAGGSDPQLKERLQRPYDTATHPISKEQLADLQKLFPDGELAVVDGKLVLVRKGDSAPLNYDQVLGALRPGMPGRVAELRGGAGASGGRSQAGEARNFAALGASFPGFLSESEMQTLQDAARLRLHEPDLRDALAAWQGSPNKGAARLAGSDPSRLTADTRDARPPNASLRGLTFRGADGKEVSLDALKKENKPVLLMFTGDWCPHCNSAQTMDFLRRVQEQYGPSGLTVLGVAVNNRSPLNEYAAHKGFPLAAMSEAQARQLGVEGYPGFLMIGRDGNVVSNSRGESVFANDQRAVNQQIALGMTGPRAPPARPEAILPGSPQAASVQIQADYGRMGSGGSGTVIGRKDNPDGTHTYTIITAAHVLANIDANPPVSPRQISVKVVVNGEERTLAGTNPVLGRSGGVKYINGVPRTDRVDVGLLSVTTRAELPVASVAGPGYKTQPGQKVLSAGYDRGGPYVQIPTQITGQGLEWHGGGLATRDLPVSGRSGGGLFDASGQLVGVCWGVTGCAGQEHGSFIGLGEVQNMLRTNNLAALYDSHSSAPPAVASLPAWWKQIGPNGPAGGTQFFAGAGPQGSCGPNGCPGQGSGSMLAGGSCGPGGCGGGGAPSTRTSAATGGSGGGSGAKKSPQRAGLGCAAPAEAADGSSGPRDVGGPELWLMAILLGRALRRRKACRS